MVKRNDEEEATEEKHPVERVSGILDSVVDVDQHIEDIRGGRTSTGRGRQADAALETIQALGDEIATGGRKFTRDEMNEA